MDNLIDQGLELAMLGMGTVFVFLTLLILATRTMSAIVLRFQADPTDAADSSAAPPGSLTDTGRTIAVISAAILQHRRKNKT